MYCKHCGNELPENSNFCPVCGKSIEDTKQEAEEATFEPINEIVDFKRDEHGGSILKFGILGLAFAVSFYFSLLGLIFSIVARVKVKSYIREYGETDGKATVGKHLSVAGSIVSIISLCLLPLVIIALVAGLSEGLGYVDAFGIIT